MTQLLRHLGRLLTWGALLLPLWAQTVAAPSDPPTPIIIDGRTLWIVKAGNHGFGAEARASDIQEAILHLARDTRRNLDDLREVNVGIETILIVSRVHVFSVTDEDARLENTPRPALMSARRQIALDAIRRYRAEHSVSIFVRSSVVSLGALFVALLVLTLLRIIYRRVAPWGLREMPARLGGVDSRIAPLVRIFEKPLRLTIRFLLRAVFLAAALITLLSALSFCLAQFPQTASLAHVAGDSLLQVLRGTVTSILSYLPNLLVVALVAAHAYVLIRVSHALAAAIERGDLQFKGFHPEWAMPTYILLKILLVLFALVVAFPYLPGGDSPALRGVSIFLGVLVSLGSGSAMGNVIAGVIITYMRPFRVGDRVRIAGTMGDVVERSLLVTRIRSIKNVEVIIPNSEVLGAHIENYSAHVEGSGLILNTTVTIGYDAPWETVHKLLILAALRTNGILPEPTPFVLQTSLNDFHISYEINAYTREPNRMADIYSDLHRHIQEEFNRAAVEIMSPTYLAVRDGNTVTTPEAHRSPGYQPPWFRVFHGK